MKIHFCVLALLLSAVSDSLSTSHAATTINSANNDAYAANFGWMDWRGDTNNGAVIGEYVCSGYIYAANVGWIHLGNGAPANQIQYQNNSTNDYGVNHDGTGKLTGYAYGANIGWINFEQTYGSPKVDLFTGKFTGSVYSANCGWISLSNAFAHVQTDSIQPGVLSTNGLPVAWLLQNFGTTNINANADNDGDGVSNASEYLAGTVPTNSASVLKITSIVRYPEFANSGLNWNAVTTRYYAIQTNASLSSGAWGDFVALNLPGWNNYSFFDTNPTNRIYRIRSYRPLMP